MARSVKKGPYIEKSLMRQMGDLGASDQKRIVRTWSLRSMVLPEMIGHTFHVHNGKLFMPVFVTENMVGHRLGEFAPTRRQAMHAGDRRLKQR